MIVLFLCDTGTSLSPLACGLMRKIAAQRGIDSRVCFDFAAVYPGKAPRPPDRLTSELAEARDISLNGMQSRLVSVDDIGNADLIIAMKEDHFWHAKELLTSAEREVQLFTKYSGQLAQREIADPLLGEADYEETFEWLERCAEGLMTHLIDRITGSKP